MSSNNAPDEAARAAPPRSLSIALRLTLWYALSTFALVLVATGALYWSLVESLYNEDVSDLSDNLDYARLLIGSSPVSQPTLAFRLQSQAAPRGAIYLRLLDRDANLLTESPGMKDELAAPTKAELAAIGSAQGEPHRGASRSGKPILSLLAPLDAKMSGQPVRYIQIAMERGHDEQFLARYRTHVWLVLGLSLVICAAIGYLIARTGMRPIEEIGRAAARIRATTLHERIDMKALPTELSGLAAAFNDMLDRLDHSFRHVSQFSDDVAHELRTPINNLRGEIEVALSKSRSADDYRAVLESCLEECGRLSHLVRTLLFLARSDTAGDGLQRQKIDVGEELRKVETYYEPAAAEAGINLEVTSPRSIYADLDRTLFQQAVGNLVTNAMTYTPTGGHVRLVATICNNSIAVSVNDTGCGIAPEHLPRVFERFYRADRARGNSMHNVGLGLAVVKSIARRHGGRVEIESEVGRGTEVRLILPAST